MATNATLFGNGGSSQSAANKTLSFTTPFHTDQVTAAVTDNNFWAKVTCNPVGIKTARPASITYNSSNRYLLYTFDSNVIINKLLSVEYSFIGNNNYTDAPHDALGAWLYASDDGYLASGATGFTISYIQKTSNTRWFLRVLENDTTYRVIYTEGTNKMSIRWDNPVNEYRLYENRNNYGMTIRYI